MFGGRKEEVGRRGRDIAAAAVEFAMFHDEIRGNPVTEKVTGAAGMIHPDREILVHLEVKVGRVHSVIVADGAYLLPPCYLLSLPHHDPIEMPVERVGKVDFPILYPGMSDHHHISPVSTDIASQNDKTIPYGMDGMTEGLPLPSGDDPVLS